LLLRRLAAAKALHASALESSARSMLRDP